jgi:chaperone BCS1
MDLFTLGRHVLTALPSGNNTDMSDLPIKLLEAVVPGYSLFANTVQQWLGFDISMAMTCLAFFFIAKRTVLFLWSKAYAAFQEYCTSSIHIGGDDDLYNTILHWIAVTRPDLSKRSLTARTQYGGYQDDWNEENGEDADMLARVAIGEHGYYNFSKTAARIPPRYEPAYGHFFFSTPRGTFKFRKVEVLRRGVDGSERTECAIDIFCVGLTTNPIKLLLADIKVWTLRKQGSKTIIRIPCSESYNGWAKSSERPSRPLDTVILDHEQKTTILRDMNEYLHPLSPRWYSARGIPYRRGYLFHGPPGTGKTSLSFSLAGIFGLDIHIINLMDPSLNESMLNRLFNNMPRRCIVLFEDIDAAGVKKRGEDDEDDDEDEDEDDADSEDEDEVPVKKTKKLESGRIKQKKTTNQIEDKAPVSSTDILPATNDESDAVKTNGIHTESTTTKGAAEQESDMETSSSSSTNSDSNPDSNSTPSSSISHKQHKHDHIDIHTLARALISASRQTPAPPKVSRHIPTKKPKSRKASTTPTPEPECKISLSGLLNVIDGVATHEGRILIMTTNHPEKLDAALVRAGRVDMKISFSYASTSQIKSLFMRMYAIDLAEAAVKANSSSSASSNLTTEELDVLSSEFAAALPEATFTPSDVQGYLLLHRQKPKDAVAKVSVWRDSKLAERLADKEKSKSKNKAGKKVDQKA